MSTHQPQSKVNIKSESEDATQLPESIDWDSERQLISSLAKLQELEAKIHELRSLLPDRLLAPLGPIVNPRRSSSANPLPRNPQELNARLAKAVTEGVAEVDAFQNLWQSPDTQVIWTRIQQKLEESKGVFPQPSGVWDRDYDGLLKQMREEEEAERKTQEPNQIASDGTSPALIKGEAGTEREGWKPIVESFQKREIPGLRIASSKNSSLIIVNLGLAGITFDLQEIVTSAPTTTTTTSVSDNGTSTTRSLPEWRVSTHQVLGKPSSRLETAIEEQLNARPRKWDLHYLLEMIQAYSDIRQTPCKKCNMMTDSQAQLPVVRRPVGPETGGSVAWEAYHTGCM